jgi:hypothetical protein
MLQLKEQSSILDFEVSGDPPDQYILTFNGGGLRGKGEAVEVADQHKVELRLGADYPRTLPQIRWLTPIIHPNISGGGPCLGAFGMTPNVRLTQIVEILWDMNRMAIYNPYSGYSQINQPFEKLRNRIGFPVDKRIMRDLAPPAPEPEEPGEPEMIMMGTLEWTPSTSLPREPEELKKLVTDWLRRNKLLYDTTVYTPEEWRERGEKYGGGAVLNIATEGPMYNMLNYGENPKLYEKWQQFLISIRLWEELGYAWSVHLYPKESL